MSSFSKIPHFRFLPAMTGLIFVFFSSLASGGVTSWWRFEVDLDPSDTGLLSPNEMGGQPPIISSDGILDTDITDLMAVSLPGDQGIINSSSLRSFNNGLESDGIFGTATYSSALDTPSLTVEFFARTTESTVGFVSRTTNNLNASEFGTITDGFSIVDPDNIRVDFFTSTSSGDIPLLSSLVSNISINDGNWHYIAFGFNASTSLAALQIDDQLFSNLIGSGAARSLWWGDEFAEPEVMVGFQMDGDPGNFKGTFDELRFSDNLVLGSELNQVPEPSQFLLGLAVFLFACKRRFLRNR